MQYLQGVLVARNMELVPSSTRERAALVRANLGCDSESAQEAEGPARDRRVGDVKVNRDLAAPAEVNAAGGMEEAGELG